jgi:hypothetical protein
MRAFDGFAAAPAVAWAEAPHARLRLWRTWSRHVEVEGSPAPETPYANAVHGEIVGAASSRQAAAAHGAG